MLTSTSISKSNIEEEVKEDLNPKMLISLEVQEASLARKLAHLKKKSKIYAILAQSEFWLKKEYH